MESHPKQLTLRGFEPELLRALRQLARQEGISLNRAALRLLRRGAGLDPAEREDDTIGDRLDEFIGTWSDAEAKEFDQATADLGRVDDSMWR
jgi:hypothetical protein